MWKTDGGKQMLSVSFAMTSDAYADGSKTETRRFWKAVHAAKFKPGTIFMGITKDFRAGGVRMHPARVVFCHQENLAAMSADSFEREGGPRYWKNRKEYIEVMGGAHRVPWVIRFEHLPIIQTLLVANCTELIDTNPGRCPKYICATTRQCRRRATVLTDHGAFCTKHAHRYTGAMP